jgi:hypothetical protein
MGPLSEWREKNFRQELPSISGTTFTQPIIEFGLNASLPFRRLYFGFALSVPNAGVTWSLPFEIMLRSSRKDCQDYTLRGKRHTANPATGVAVPPTSALPQFSVQWIPSQNQEWFYDVPSPQDSVQWFTDDEDSFRMALVTSAPLRIAGPFDRASIRFFEPASSNASSNERVTIWFGVHSSNVP